MEALADIRRLALRRVRHTPRTIAQRNAGWESRARPMMRRLRGPRKKSRPYRAGFEVGGRRWLLVTECYIETSGQRRSIGLICKTKRAEVDPLDHVFFIREVLAP